MSAKDEKAVSAPIGFFTAPAQTTANGRKRSHQTLQAAASIPSAPVSQPAYAGGSGTSDPSAGFVGFGGGAQ
jgi:hypothetical protein